MARSEGFVTPKPGADGDWFFITRRGKNVNDASDLRAYVKSNLLPKKQLHPLIAQKVWATFLRADYDTAVFQTFKEVEVSVSPTFAIRAPKPLFSIDFDVASAVSR